jgi:hypothetical protein
MPREDAEEQGDDASKSRGRRPRRRIITEKGKGRNLKIPDSVFRRLELEAVRQRIDNSKLVTRILDRELPVDIQVVVGNGQPQPAEE